MIKKHPCLPTCLFVLFSASFSLAYAEIGPVFEIAGLSVQYDGQLHTLEVTGTALPIYWRAHDTPDMIPYGIDVDFHLFAENFEIQAPSSGLAHFPTANFSLTQSMTDTVLLQGSGVGSLSNISYSTPQYVNLSIFTFRKEAGTFQAGSPISFFWPSDTHLSPEFLDWNTNYTGTTDAQFYWSVPEPHVLFLFMPALAVIIRHRKK